MSNEFVCFIVHKQNGKFKAQLGSLVQIEEDDDAIIYITHSGPAMDTLEQAQNLLKEAAPEDAKVFMTPIKANPMGEAFWLSQLQNLEAQA